MKGSHGGCSGQGGFSLLEILVAMMVLMIGLTSVIFVFAQGVTLQARSKRDMDTSRLAQSVASEIQFLANEYETLPPEQTFDAHAGFSDQYSVEIRHSRIDLMDDRSSSVPFEQTAYGVRITVISTFRGARKEDVYSTAVVVPD